jgi:NADH dehydrogenase
VHQLWKGDVTLVEGSLHDVEALHQAMLGVHTVFHLASAQWWGSRRDLDNVDVQGTASIITAARSARIGRLALVSHLGAAPSSAFTLLRAKGQVEEMVRASGLAYTIFRSGVVFGKHDVFVNGIAAALRTNPLIFLQPGQGESLLHPIFIDDLVEALVRSLEALNTVDQVLEVGGPEYMTFNEMVRTVMRVTSTPRFIVSVPPYLLRTLTGTLQRLFRSYPITPQWFDLLASNRVGPLGSLYDTFGIRPVRFEDTLLTYMRERDFRRDLMRTMRQRRRTA